MRPRYGPLKDTSSTYFNMNYWFFGYIEGPVTTAIEYATFWSAVKWPRFSVIKPFKIKICLWNVELGLCVWNLIIKVGVIFLHKLLRNSFDLSNLSSSLYFIKNWRMSWKPTIKWKSKNPFLFLAVKISYYYCGVRRSYWRNWASVSLSECLRLYGMIFKGFG